jgi:hypothetical protein
MNEAAKQESAHQPNQPEDHEYYKDRPKHGNLLLLYDITSQVLISSKLQDQGR